MGFFFFKQKTAYAVLRCLEFRRVLFRSVVTEMVPASSKHSFSPRFGFAIPVTDHSFLLANLGYFFQVPLFDHLYSGLDINLKKQNAVLVGNPDLKPQKTKSYELSYRQIDRKSVV